ncbi:MAG: diaminopimelate decarboxylase family protein [Promethearchaeota archaeon]
MKKPISGNQYLMKDGKNVWLDDIKLDDFIKCTELPIMVILENRIRENIKSFIQTFTSTIPNTECFYSVKANFLPKVIKVIAREGIGVEIVGEPELDLVLKLNIPGFKIICGGPYLTESLIEKCLQNDIREVIAYNLFDLKRIDYFAKKYGKIQKICLRINSQKYNSNLGISFNVQNIKILKRYIKKFQNIEIETILSHYTTQMNSLELFKRNCNSIINALKLLKDNGIHVKNVNLGGGFPEAAIMTKNQLRKVAILIKEMLIDHSIDLDKIYFEPGRYFVGDAGIFITKIINVLENRWIYLNIGNNMCPKFARCSLRFYNATLIDSPHKYKTSIGGIVPTDQDVLVKDYFFTKKLKRGHVILITNVGAYCLTFSNRFPYPMPKIYNIIGNKSELIFDPKRDRDFTLN